MTTKKKWHVMPAVVATTIMSFCGVLIETSMNVTFPTLMKQFGVDAGLIQWVTTANLLTVAISIPLSAYLIRNVSEKNLFVSSNLFFLLGVILDSIAGNRTAFSRSHPSGNRHRTDSSADVHGCDADLPAEEAGTCDGHQRTCHHVCTGNRTDRHGHRPRSPLMACRLLHVCNHFTCRTSFCLHRSEERQPHHPSED